jgi:fructoselysine and glucoselysine-specific PTS system IIB component
VRFLLIRIDDRLLHGQVAYGCGGALQPRHYLIVDDRAASDTWESEAYRASTCGAPVEVWDLARFAREWAEVPDAAGTVVLLRDLASLHRLWRLGFRPEGGVNLGGAHARPGTREHLPFVHLTAEEEQMLAQLLDAGCELFAQDLPRNPLQGSATLRGWANRG